jgi:hypothetical protein
MDRMNLFFNLFNSRLGLTPTGRVYINLVSYPGTNDIYIENTKSQTLEFEDSLPYLLALDGSSGLSDSNMMLIAIIIIAIVIIGLLMFLRR